jgi:arylsulfatase A-like enzyme
MKHTHFLPYTAIGMAMAGLAALPSFAGNPKEKASRPNILFIAIDDLKPVLGCYGDKLVKTPNIDRLAARGTVFLQNYCQQAVCGPTRASLMTGMRPDYTHVWDLKTKMRDINPEILFLPQYFISKGYQTAGIGKIYDPRCVDDELDKPSWGFFDFSKRGETIKAGDQSFLEGYQSVPVDWGINSQRKKDFFQLLSKISKN